MRGHAKVGKWDQRGDMGDRTIDDAHTRYVANAAMTGKRECFPCWRRRRDKSLGVKEPRNIIIWLSLHEFQLMKVEEIGDIGEGMLM